MNLINPLQGAPVGPDPWLPLAAGARSGLHVAFIGGRQDAVAAGLADLLRDAFGQAATCSAIAIDGASGNLADAATGHRGGDPLWRALCRATDWPWAVAAGAAVLRPLALRRLRALAAGKPARPDVLVATQVGAAQCLQALADSYAVPPRTVVVVTDAEPHRAWFAPADHHIVASPLAHARAREAGLPDVAITLLPLLPCRRARRSLQAAELAAGLAGSRHLRLLATTGDGGSSAQPLCDLLQRLDHGPAGPLLQVDALCGHDPALRGALLDLSARLCRVQLRVHGPVADRSSRLAAADLALLPAQSVALAEAVSAGTPVLAYDWAHDEAANARQLEAWGCGLASRDTETLAQALEGVSVERARLAPWAAAARALAAQAPDADFARTLVARLGLAMPARGLLHRASPEVEGSAAAYHH